jgi:drug/metabolite transporter (DMT)-like permease
MDGHRPQLALPLALSFAILAASTASILIRFAQREAPSLTIAALRLGIASLLLAPLVLLHQRDRLQSIRGRALCLAAASGLFLAIHFATWITSLEYTTVASSVVFVSTGPLWVGLLTPIVLREPTSRSTFYGLFLAMLGGLAIAVGGSCQWGLPVRCPPVATAHHQGALLGNLLALLGAFAVAGYLMVGRRLRAEIPLLPYVFVVYGFATVFLAFFAAIARQSAFGYGSATYLWILLLALVPQLLGHSTYNWALKYAPATLVAAATLGEPIGSSVLALAFLKETPPPSLLLGGILILAGVFIVSRQAPLTVPD